jgi:hypothetical protein
MIRFYEVKVEHILLYVYGKRLQIYITSNKVQARYCRWIFSLDSMCQSIKDLDNGLKERPLTALLEH